MTGIDDPWHMLSDEERMFCEVLERICADRIAPLIKEHMVTASTPSPSPPAIRRLARRLAPATLAEWALVVEADKGARGAASRTGETAEWMSKAAALGVVHGPQPPILRGAHLITAGMSPGPVFGEVLKLASRAQENGAFEDESGALAWLATHMRS